MKTMTAMCIATMLSLVAIPQAFAATTHVYSSGLLVLAFLGFCALVVVVQLIPALITLWGIVKELVSGRKEKEAKVQIRG